MRRISLVWCLSGILLLVSAGLNTAFAGWTNITPAVSTKTLYGVWGTSATDVYAVGADGVIVHFNGTDWSVETSNTTSLLYAVWGSSSTNIYAVGKEDAVEGTATLLHKTSSGTSWGKEPLKDYKTGDEYNFDLSAVWGLSANAVYVGSKGYVLVFDGTGWFATDPNPYIGNCAVTGIWGVNSTNIFIVDECSNDVSKFVGDDWPYEDTGNTGNLNEIWGTSLSDIYVAGSNGFIARNNGSAWLAVSSGTSKTLNSIHGSSSANIIAVGLQGAIVHNRGAGFVDESFNTVKDLFGVWVAPDGSAAYAVGTDGMILKYTPDAATTTTTTIAGATTTTTVSGGTTTTTPGGTSTTTTVPGGTTTTIPGTYTTSIVPEGEVGADFIGNPLTGKAPLPVQFTNLSGGDIANYQWVFGDGAVSTEKNPSHIYEKAGTYSVILTVFGTDNTKTATKTRDSYITVKRSCALTSSLASPQQLALLRDLRDSRLETAGGVQLTALYYRNTAEINEILDDDPELRLRLQELVGKNIDIFRGLLRGEPVILSGDALSGAVDYIDALSARGSMKLQRDIELVKTGINNGYFLSALGITLE